jgi:hypothetical protein
VHRTGPLGSGGYGDGRARVRIQEAFGIVPELFEAAFVAEVIGLALVLVMPDGVIRRDRHPADRIDDLRGCDGVLLVH